MEKYQCHEKQTNKKIRMWGNIYEFLLHHDENSYTEVTKNIIRTIG